MQQLLLLIALITHTFCLLNLDLNLKTPKNQFTSFSMNNGKKYQSNSESKYREAVFIQNMKLINSLNSGPNATFKQGLTFYSDFTSEEFTSLILNPRIITTPEAIESFKNLFTGLAGVTDSLFKTVTGLTGSVGGLVGKLGLPLLNTAKEGASLILPVNGLLNTVGSGLSGILLGLGGGNKASAKTSKSANSNSNANKNTNVNTNNNANQNANLSPSKTANTNAAPAPPVTPSAPVQPEQFRFAPSKDIKASVDWRSSKWVSDVKMQGVCGNCYAFSATGALQSAYMIKHNRTGVSYSDQQLTECCGQKGFGCSGCDGGWQWQAFQYVKTHGIVTQRQYPTTSSEQGIVGQCQKIISPFKIINQKTPFKALPQGNVTALYEAVSKQPVSVGVDSANMQFASSTNPNQLFTNCSSSFDDANHAMLVVGYDKQGNWILKNSWSNNWGNQGYIKLKAGNTCGIANYALYPIVN